MITDSDFCVYKAAVFAESTISSLVIPALNLLVLVSVWIIYISIICVGIIPIITCTLW